MAAFVVFCAFLVAAIGVARLAPNRWLKAVWVAAPFVIAVLLIVYERRASIYLQAPISVDEAQFLADAIKVASGRWVPWVDFDTGTVGFVIPYSLVPIVMALPDAPYAGARVFAVVCAAIWASGAFLALRTTLPRSASLVLASPLLLIAAFPGSGDLLTFSSELLPLALATGGFGLALNAASRERALWVTGVGFCALGLVPFAKLQVAPIAFLYAVIAVTLGGGVVAMWRDRRRLYVAIGAGLLPLLLVLLGVLVSAQFRLRVQDTIAFTQSYTAGGDPWQVTLRFFFRGAAFYDLALASIACAVLGFVLLVVSRRVREHLGRRALSMVAIVAPLGLISMALPGRGFPHYVWVGAVPALFGVLALCGVVLSLQPHLRQRAVLVVVGAIILVVLAPSAAGLRERLRLPPLQLTQDVWDSSPYFPPSDPPQAVTGLGSPNQLAVKRALAVCQEPIGVWGWDPQILVVTHRAYIGRSSVVPQEDTPAQSAWAGAMVGARPECIVDATGPGHFLFTCDGCRLEQMTFGAAVLDGYRQILKLPDYRVYQRID